MREIEFRAFEKDAAREPYDLRWWSWVEILEMDVNDLICRGQRGEMVFMQWTGLTDVNGQKIFEGDIMAIEQNGHVVVEIQEGCAGAFADGGFSPFRKSIWGVGGVVVGNIHDNPELLELE